MKKTSQVRKVVTRSPKRKVGLINCRWFQDFPVEHESQLEKRFVHSSMLCLGIRQIRSQPFRLELDGKTYTPDFLVDFGHAKAVVEVKINSKVASYATTFDQVVTRLAEKGFKFYVITERGVDGGHHAHVAAEILRYAKSQIAPDTKQSVLNLLPSGQEIELAELERSAQVTREVILHLLAIRWLSLHPDDPIGEHARISRSIYSPESDVAGFERRFQIQPWSAGEMAVTPKSRQRRDLKKRPTRATCPYLRQGQRREEEKPRNPLAVLAGGLECHPSQRKPLI